ncbi:PBCV-specific basic adaptor domain-containing protein [Paramecium bursaria Chlorella virus CvsA1]|nr:PBCV-specific basic adaptor domain-containing protein [Paramecium bursaria Chlorella virus CvsA1]AGE55133.1 PBCV-specific basic adaptor domain-containing protein [Paramecium bursaria Chlorella virus MA1E]
MYPRPEKSKSFMSHDYCRDAVCKKIFGVIPRRSSKELRVKIENTPKDFATKPVKITLEKIPILFGGKILVFVAKGSYGSVYKMKPNGKFVDYLKRVVLPRTTDYIGNVDRIPTDGTLAVIKFQETKGPAQKEAILKEIAIHSSLSRSKISSKLYAAGFIGDIAWQISSYVDGTGMCDVKITADIFKKIEKTVFELWKHNIFHADLHCNNLMITRKKDIVVIDFGRAIVLPKKLVPKTLTEFRNIKYQEKVQRYADSIITGRSKKNSNYVGATIDKKGEVIPLVVYSNDVHALRVFYDKMSTEDKKQIR